MENTMQNKSKNWTVLTILITVTALTIFSCSKESPLGPDNNLETANNNVIQSDTGTLNFLSFTNESLDKRRKVVDLNPIEYITDTEFVTYKDGGELILEFKAEDYNMGDVYCKSTLKIFSETISENCEVELNLNTSGIAGNVDVTFQPHGITFSESALLNIEAKNMNLSGIDSKLIGLYYDNPETGMWEKMATKEIIVKEDEGYIKIIDGELPHFSRYAVAYGR